tara:strand:+ start:382 stop:597 length:216 start_codon:yes stop_codon:yes gene_type:complete
MKTKIKKETNNDNISAFEVLGGLLIIFAIADFAASWMGVNLTPFMGSVSRYSPIIFGLIGTFLMNLKKGDG